MEDQIRGKRDLNEKGKEEGTVQLGGYSFQTKL
jgi:hypothetical protein